MLIDEFDKLLQDACPPGANEVFAILMAGIEPNLSVRKVGTRGQGLISKYVNSFAHSDLRLLTNTPPRFQETKILFQFLALIEVGSIKKFRSAWYREYGNLAIRAHGRLYTKTEMIRLVPHRELQFQIKVDLDTHEVSDITLSPKLEARIHSPNSLQVAMQNASKVNLAKLRFY